MKKLMDVCDIQYGYAFDSKKFSDDSSFIPLIRIRDVKRGYSETFYSGTYSKEYIVHRNDLLIGMDGEFNIARWSSNEALLNQRVCKIVAKNGTNEEYLRFAMSRKLKEIEEKTSFVTVKHLSAKELKKIILKMPNIEKQNKIANILVKLEDIIKVYKKELEKLNSLVQSRFVEEFGDLKINPKKWKIKTFDEMTDLITDGEHATPRRTEEGIYLLSARNIMNHTIKLEDVDYIDQAEYDRISKRIHPKEGDVLISCSGTVGRCCSVPAELKFQMVRSVALLRFKNEINPIFAEYMITSDYLKEQIDRSKTQSSQANLFQGKIKKIKGFVPPIDLQNQFAAFVQQVNKSKFVIHKFLYCTTHNTKSIIKPRPNTKESGKIRGGKPHADEF